MKIFTIDTLATLLQCSVRTAWRKLRQWNAFTSYNHNAKYHALSTIPRFDRNGIWRCNDVFFSRYGNLTQTVAHLVAESDEGMDAQQLCSILGVSARSLYTHFRGIKQIVPQRIGRTLIFFSSQNKITQLALRASHAPATTTLPRCSDAVLILVDRIRYPDDAVQQCARRLHAQSPAITPEVVDALLRQYGIGKKTPDTH